MKKHLPTLYLALLFGLLSLPEAMAQISVSGKVLNFTDSEPLPGVTVLVKGTSNGTVTDVDGNFSLSVPDAASVLVFSFVGYNVQEIAVGNKTKLTVKLMENIDQLEAVVVTALGIEKDTRGLAYTTQQVDGEELTRAKDPNLMNALSGKIAGVNINRSAGGVGGSVKVNIRGNRSAIGGNQPLYVIDGIPMLNSTPSQPLNAFGGDRNVAGRDGGDGIANLNPDDIESINVLKGASASALYGSQAANGVILITTKKGKSGTARIEFSSNVSAETPLLLPEFQSRYGQKTAGSSASWGPALAKDAPVAKAEDFFQTGVTYINSIALTGGTENAQTYFSYANTSSDGILPTSEYHRNNFTLRQSTQLFDSKLRIDANINYLTQRAQNRPSSGLYFNPLVGTYLFPRGLDFAQYENAYEVFNDERKIMAQNWYVAGSDAEDFNQNPYWLLNRTPREDTRNRIIGAVTLRYNIFSWMNIQGRLNVDRVSDEFTNHIYAFSHPNLSHENGRYIKEDRVETQVYSDILLNVNQQFNDFSLAASVGASINDNQLETDIKDSGRAGLKIANVFTASNMLEGSVRSEQFFRKQLQGVFGTAQIGYKDMVYLDLTGRNDWSSALAFTPNTSYFYPSVGMTFIINEMLPMPAAINLAKLRASYARVGNDVPAYVTNPSHTQGPDGEIIKNDAAPFIALKPEMSSSLEFGGDFKFFANRLNLSLTYYKTNTTDQYFPIVGSNTTGYKIYYINAGDIQNSGVEALLGYTMLRGDNLNWTTTLNFSRNKNKILELSPELNDEFVLTEAGSNSYQSKIELGGSYGDFYGPALQRAPNGAIYVNPDGSPVPTEEFVKLGNPNPAWQLGFLNELSWKGLNFSFLIDARVGGQVMSITQAMMDAYGVSQVTADARAAGGVDVPAIIVAQETEGGEVTPEKPFEGKIDAETYYSAVGNRSGISGEYVYSATNVRMREISLGYTFQKLAFAKNVRLSVVGRNLFFLKRNAPYDPEISMSTGNNLQGIDVFGLPTTRSVGLNLSVTF